MAPERPNIHLYTHQTPNGIKISIALEELELPYQVTDIDIDQHTQKEPWFLEINPNGRIPAITDTFTDGTTIRVFETGAILQYIIEQYDKDHKISYPKGTKEYYEMNNWVGALQENVQSLAVCIFNYVTALLPSCWTRSHARTK